MLKNNDWHCFEIPAEINSILEIDYQITGVDPENTNFEARQSGQVIAHKENLRSSFVEARSIVQGENINLCWQKTDKKSKKLDFDYKRNKALSWDAADVNTLDSLSDDLQLLMDELVSISRNIEKQKDIE